jgi:hypothetical protein
MRSSIRILSLLLSGAYAIAQAQSPAVLDPRLAGEWIIDRAHSERFPGGETRKSDDAEGGERRPPHGGRGGPPPDDGNGPPSGGKGGDHSKRGGSRGDHGGLPSRGDGEETPDRGLARLFTPRLTIAIEQHVLRLDDGRHNVAIGLDGMPVSGAGIGATSALTALAPEAVIETLTESGWSVVERLTLSDDGKRLVDSISVKAAGQTEAKTFTRTFVAASESTPEEAPPPPHGEI